MKENAVDGRCVGKKMRVWAIKIVLIAFLQQRWALATKATSINAAAGDYVARPCDNFSSQAQLILRTTTPATSSHALPPVMCNLSSFPA